MGADPPLIQEAWHRIKGWYKAAVDCAPPPARVTLKQITAERVALYNYVPPPGENIPIDIQLFHVDDSVPEEGEIEWAVRPSGMQTEHVKHWLAATQKSEKDGETVGG